MNEGGKNDIYIIIIIIIVTQNNNGARFTESWTAATHNEKLFV